MSIIRNADDFGKSQEVNEAIISCFLRNAIERATLMVNMPYADSAVESAMQNGFFDRVGIHLNLTEGMPLTDPIRQNPLFCDADGRFHALFCKSTKYRLYLDNLSREQVYIELSAQLKKYKEYGLTLFHVDSHHHVHTNYPIYLALKSLSKEYDFVSVRLSRNLYRGGNVLNRMYKGLYNGDVKKICSETSDLFGSFSDFINYGNDDELKRLTDEKSVEIMLHPMYKNGILTDTDTPMDEVVHKIDKIRNFV